MSKSRRRVTVERDEEDDKRKPSVFERLGTGGLSRTYEGQSYSDKCRNWLKYGTCTYGSNCRYSHGDDSKKGSSPEAEDLRRRVDRKRSERRSSSSSPKRKHSKTKKTKEGKLKSTVVISKHKDVDSDGQWRGTGDETELDFDEELLREKKRLEQELSQLAEEESRMKHTKQSSDSTDSEDYHQPKQKKTKKIVKGPKTPSPVRRKSGDVKKGKKLAARSPSPKGRSKKRAPSPEDSDSSSSSSSSSSSESSSPSPPPSPVKEKHKKKKGEAVPEKPSKSHKSYVQPVRDISPRDKKKAVKTPKSPQGVKSMKHVAKRDAESSYYDIEKYGRSSSRAGEEHRSRSPAESSKRSYSPQSDYRSAKQDQKRVSSVVDIKHKPLKREVQKRSTTPQESRRRRSLSPQSEKDYRSRSPAPLKHSYRQEESERTNRRRSPEYKRSGQSSEPQDKYRDRKERSPDYKKQDDYRKGPTTPPRPSSPLMSRERFNSPSRDFRREGYESRKKPYTPEKDSRHEDPRGPYTERDYRTRSHERPVRESPPRRGISPTRLRPRSPSPRDRYADPRDMRPPIEHGRERDLRRPEEFLELPPHGRYDAHELPPFGRHRSSPPIPPPEFVDRYSHFDRGLPPPSRHSLRGPSDSYSPGRGRSRGGRGYRGRGGYDNRFRGERETGYYSDKDRRGWERERGRDDPRMDIPDDPRMDRPPFDPRLQEDDRPRFRHQEMSPGRHPGDRERDYDRGRPEETPPVGRRRGDEDAAAKYRSRPDIDEERGRRRDKSPAANQYREEDVRTKYKSGDRQRDISSPSRERASRHGDEGGRGRRKDVSPSASSHHSDGGKQKARNASPHGSRYGDEDERPRRARSPEVQRYSRDRERERDRDRDEDKRKERDGEKERDRGGKPRMRKDELISEFKAERQDKSSPMPSERRDKSSSSRRGDNSPHRSERRDKRSLEREEKIDKRDEESRERKRKRSPSPVRDEKERKRPHLADSVPASPQPAEVGTPTVDEAVRLGPTDTSTDVKVEEPSAAAEFSDWSDEDMTAEPSPVSDTKSEQRDDKPEKPKQEKQTEEDEAKGPETMEYDPISDDELDELLDDSNSVDQPIKSKSVDALDIDWASLMKHSKPKVAVEGSALKRFTPANVFSRLGLASEYAGDAVMEKIRKACQDELDKEAQESGTAARTFKFESDIAGFHVNIVESRKARESLVTSVGEFRRALCARRDLRIRRTLCKLDKSVDQALLYPSPVYDRDLHNLSIQLFRSGQPSSSSTVETA